MESSREGVGDSAQPGGEGGGVCGVGIGSGYSNRSGLYQIPTSQQGDLPLLSFCCTYRKFDKNVLVEIIMYVIVYLQSECIIVLKMSIKSLFNQSITIIVSGQTFPLLMHDQTP
jgi:hypothetical protein